jgi:uncharacterized membrane protein
VRLILSTALLKTLIQRVKLNYTMGFFKGLFLIALGAYGGIYVSNKYDIPKMDSPCVLTKKFAEFLKEYEKKPPISGAKSENDNNIVTKEIAIDGV